MICTIEELSMNAWPAMQTMLYDGWVVRSADGYTKRANSVYPLYDSKMALDVKIEFCESLYRDLGLPAVFKMTKASTPENLDARLESLGYRIDSPTSVQTLDLGVKKHEIPSDVDLASDDTEAWHEAFARMNNVSPDRRTTHENIVRAITPGKCYASISADGRMIGCGLGVLQAGYIGIFDIVIDPEHRGQGHGTRLMEALLAWGKGTGANASYLQVMCNNAPALRLYENLGFQERYRYWYRIRS
jgi:ribosomal protein S18 acetylase RimI-like enzyme